jgi:hypothetical protein
VELFNDNAKSERCGQFELASTIKTRQTEFFISSSIRSQSSLGAPCQMSSFDRQIPPMDLGNMRQNGVRTLAIHCGGRWCNHEAILDVSDYADDVAVPAFGPRMVCTVCGAIGADARPNWNERAPACLFGAKH